MLKKRKPFWISQNGFLYLLCTCFQEFFQLREQGSRGEEPIDQLAHQRNKGGVDGGGDKSAKANAVEAGVTLGWTRYTKREDRVLGINKFGASAPGGVVAEHYGMTAANVAAMVKEFF